MQPLLQRSNLSRGPKSLDLQNRKPYNAAPTQTSPFLDDQPNLLNCIPSIIVSPEDFADYYTADAEHLAPGKPNILLITHHLQHIIAT